MIIPLKRDVPSDFFWLNAPEYVMDRGELILHTANDTDYWQRTRYGFSRDNGHALLSSVSNNFTMSVRTRFDYQSQYDQCGLMARVDALNWIKVSVEREDNVSSRLGSVVTNLGYSDWATTDVEATIDEVWYRIRCTENDFHIESSYDGTVWTQMRLAHLHSRQRPLNIGIYACSPKTGGFKARFSDFVIDQDKP